VARSFGYEAVTPSKHRTVNSNPLQSEDRELLATDRHKMISQNRDLSRNFAIAAWAIRKHLDFVSSYSFSMNSDDKVFNKRVEELVKWWSRPLNFDAAGRHSLSRFTRIAESHNVVDGDFFAHKLENAKLRGIEGDLIRKPEGTTRAINQPSRWVHGIRTNGNGAAISYAAHRRHINLHAAERIKFDRFIPARNMVHLGNMTRISQTRGISPLASAFNDFHDVSKNKDYALAKSKIAQLFGLVIYRDGNELGMPVVDESVLDEDSVTEDVNGAGNDENCDLQEDVGPRYEVNFGEGPIHLELEGNDRAQFLENKTPSAEFQQFMLSSIGIALKSLDIPYSFYDEAHTNFFGSKAALIIYMKSCLEKRKVLQEFLRQITIWRLRLFIISGELVLPAGKTISDIPFKWVPTGIPWFDPRDVKADLDAIKGNLTTRTETRLLRFGDSWEDMITAKAEEEELMRTLGVVDDAMPEPTEPAEDEAGDNPKKTNSKEDNDKPISK